MLMEIFESIQTGRCTDCEFTFSSNMKASKRMGVSIMLQGDLGEQQKVQEQTISKTASN